MHLSYDIFTDRFFVCDTSCIKKNKYKLNQLDKFEYFRYVPWDEASKKYIRKFLANVPHEICFEITNKCNLLCPVCIANANDSNDSFLPLDFIQEKIKELPNHIQRITITGGEPTLHSKVDDILRTSIKKHATVLSTNCHRL